MLRRLFYNVNAKVKRISLIVSVIIISLILILAPLLYIFYFRPRIPEYHFSLEKSIIMDGGNNGADLAVGLYYNEFSNFLFTTGYVSVPGEGTNIWLGKFDSELNLQTENTFNGPANSDDMGYTLASDGSYLFVVGYISEIAEDHNIWLAKYDFNLVLQDYITINGNASSTDDGYGILYTSDHYLLIAGTVTCLETGNDCYIGKFDTNLNPISEMIINGPANSTDKARFLTESTNGDIYASGSMTTLTTGYDIWLGKFSNSLNYLDYSIIAGLTTEEDKGYGILFDETNRLFVSGTISEVGEGYNIWLAELDSNLDILNNYILNGPGNGEDVAYSIIRINNFLYINGVYTEPEGNQNIILAKFNLELKLITKLIISGTDNLCDGGFGIIYDNSSGIYVSGFITNVLSDTDMWLAHYTI
ncbi:MAG: hypothetical protein FK734_15650 [Asgard group archaeon]|nr:hypothetical protein [Asgard group archaeon]